MNASGPEPFFTLEPFRLKHTLKTVLAALLAINLAMRFHWASPYWSVITVFIVMLPLVGAAVQKSLLRLAGTVLGALAGVVLVALFPQSQFLLCLALLGIFLAAMQFAESNYAVFLGLGTLVVVVFAGLFLSAGLWHIACYRSAEIALGVVVALLVNTFLWPRRAGDSLDRLFGQLLERMEVFFRTQFGILLAEPGAAVAETDVRVQEKELLQAFPGLRRMFDLAVRDSDAVRWKQAGYARLLHELRGLFNALAFLRHRLEPAQGLSDVCRKEFEPELRMFGLAVEAEFRSLAVTLSSGRPAPTGNGVPAAFERVGLRLDALRRLGVTRLYPLGDVVNLFALSNTMRQLERSLAAVRQAAEELVGNRPGEKARQTSGPNAKWNVDPEKLKRGLRFAVGFFVMLYAWLFLQWPSGLQTMISYFVIAAQPNLPAANHKILLRLSGALIGCALAVASIALVLPLLNSIGSLSVLLFVVLGLCAYTNSGPERFAYLGLQAAICFSLTMAHDAQNTITVVTAVDRAVGIMAGAVFASLSMRFLWPPVPGRELGKNISKIFGLLHNTLKKGRDASFRREEIQELTHRFPELLDACHLWLGQMMFYREGEREKVRELLETLQFLSFKLLALINLQEQPLADPALDRFGGILVRFQEAMEQVLHDSGVVFQKKKRGERLPEMEPLIRRLRAEILRVREERASVVYSTSQAMSYLGVLETYESLAEQIDVCRKRIGEIDFSDWSFEIPL